ncbi:MAG TPA: TonB family protein [Pyrinomonadaceae bacterium]|nr:TonB family protein [Pyrinomonadaceae bacterium]
MKRLSSVVFDLIILSFVTAVVVSAQDELPKAIKGGILNGKAVSLPKPMYPSDAKADGVSGTVWVNVEIDESGTVTSAVASIEPQKVKRQIDGEVREVEVPPADERLRQAAELAALQARFSPTLLSGQTVKVSGTIVYNFVAEASASNPMTSSLVRGGILNSRAASLPMPNYPPAATAVRAEGTVVVQITIDEGGNVVEASAVSGHPLLRAAAVQAAKLATFAPTRLEGQPVRVSGVLTYNFVGPKKEDSN